ncbi:hypothetical protein N7540_011241 [Penicillium herquei]|nr:hypothetical protein N7540_011241 [Penicillium herquei]
MVSLRIIQRTIFNRLFGLDDGLIIVALYVNPSRLSIKIKGLSSSERQLTTPVEKFGLGRNIWTIPFAHITKELELLYIAEVCYMAAEALTQLSFLAFYLRIFPIRSFQIICYCLMGLSICFGISNSFVMIFQCTPIPYFWSGWTGEYAGSCIDINGYSWYKAAVQIAMDLGIIGLPIWPLLHTAMGLKKKVQIILMFCTGFFPSRKYANVLQDYGRELFAIEVIRKPLVFHVWRSNYPSDANTPAVYWSVVECDVAIICACMPCIPSLLKNLFPSVFGVPSSYYDDPRKHQNSDQSVPLERIKKGAAWHASSSETHLVNESIPGKPLST